MTRPHPIVFLVDVDNTLVDNDGIQQDLKDHLEQTYGVAARDRYWRILEDLMVELGYRDYIGALQNFRVEHPREVELLAMSSYLMDYPFAERVYPNALEVLKHLRSLAPTVILSDGDVVFQPRKVEHAGLAKVTDGNVLIYILVDDKLRILDAVKQVWGARVTTVLPRQGQYAHDAKVMGALPPADITIERIGDLLHYDLARLRTAALHPA
jgi:plasmid stabilization system protein ParE